MAGQDYAPGFFQDLLGTSGPIAPGAAVHGALEDFLLQKEMRQRRSLEDQLSIDQEHRLQQTALEVAQDREQRLKDWREDRQTAHEDRVAALEEKKVAAREKVVKDFWAKVERDYVPGSPYLPETLDEAARLGIDLPSIHQKEQVNWTGPQAQVMDDSGTAYQVPSKVTTPAMRLYPGNAVQQKEQQDELQAQAMLRQIATIAPDDPRRTALLLQYSRLPRANVPGELYKQGGGGKQIVLIDDETGVITDMLTKKPLAPNEVSSDAHFVTKRQARDTTFQELAREDRLAGKVQSSREQGYDEFNALLKPIRGHLSAADTLGTVLNQNTPVADSTIAPLVLKATIAGEGSGFRMTQGEILQTIGARSWFDSLEPVLNKWFGDGGLDGKAGNIILTDTQKQDIRKLARAIRDKAKKKSKLITDARHRLDKAKDLDEANDIRSQVEDTLRDSDDDWGDDGLLRRPDEQPTQGMTPMPGVQQGVAPQAVPGPAPPPGIAAPPLSPAASLIDKVRQNQRGGR